MKKYKWSYLLAIFVFLISNLFLVPVSAQTATLSATLDTNPLGGGPAPLIGLTMTATAGGTATGLINYYFYCNASNDNSTTVVPGQEAHSIIGTNSTTVTTPAGICDDVYDTIGTYLAKVIIQRGGIAAEERRTVGVFNPVPTVDLKIRPLGTTDWSDWTINLDYNTAAEIRWTFSGASFCTMSGDWSGTKTAPGQESTGNLTEAKTYIYTLECNTSSGLLTDTVLATVAPPTLFGSISAAPASGTAPLAGVILTANVTGGTAVGTINYTFYCNRSDTGTNITLDYNYKRDGETPLTLSAPSNACNSIYANAGTYTAKVIIERGGIAREYRTIVTVNPPPPPTVNLTADSINLAYNTSTTLRWTVSNATTCTPQSGPTAWTSSGSKAIPTGSWPTGNLTGPANYTYTLTCTGLGGTRSGSVTIVVGSPPAPIVDLTADSVNLTYNTSTTLRWTVSNADSCTGTGPANWVSVTKTLPTGSWSTGNLTVSTTYTLNCTGPGGTRSDSVIVGVGSPPQPPTVDLTADSINIIDNTSTTLRWTVSNATTCTPQSGPTAWTSSGSKAIPTGSWPTGNLTGPANYTYTLTCTGLGGTTTDSVIVTVGSPPPPFVELWVDNYYKTRTVVDGTSVFLNWNTGDPEPISCEGHSTPPGNWSDGSKNPGGGWDYTGNLVGSIDPLVINQYTFTITCYNSAGVSRSDSVVVYVTPEYDVPFVELEVRPVGEAIYTQEADVDYGESIELRWTVENAFPGTTCEASEGWSGPKAAIGGTQIIRNLTVTRQYILTCTGPGGTDFDSTFVIVNSPPFPRVTLGVRPEGGGAYSSQAQIDCNDNVELEWEVSDVQSCTAQGNWSGSKSASGGVYTSYYLVENTYYLLTCENPVGEIAYDRVEVYVNECGESEPIIFINPLEQNDIRSILDSLSGLIRMIAIVLAGIMIIVSGIIIITSVDDRERLNKGKNMLKWALIGLAIALASSFIIGFLEEIISSS